MKLKFLAPALLAGFVAFTSCSKEDNKKPDPAPQGAKEVKDLDASDEQKWVYFSFEKGTTVEVTNPRTTDNWDIAFNRLSIRTNGGVSGSGEAEVVNTNSKDFAAVTKAPAEGYEKDRKVTEVGRPAPGQTQPSVKEVEKNPVISGTVMVENSKGWCNYNRPKEGENTPHYGVTKYVYVLKTAKGNKYVKIQLTSYTKSDQPDKSGFITFTYDFLTEKEAPKPVEKVALDFAGNEAKEVQLDATGDWKYFSLKNGEVTPATPADDLTWDIAFKGYYVKLNGGTSGKGKAEAFRTEEKDFTKITEAPKKGFEKDKEVTFSSRDGSSSKENVSPILTGGFGSTTGAIGLNPANIAKYGNVYGPNEWVYVIKTADGTYAKIQVTDFYNQVGDKKVPGFPKLKYQLSKTVSE
ncbi:HmuY family protein [Capnocytophaga granulosa]|uniref:HmuY family protein n=1 Tax=Capnocytophaga granulosa TaxID=45242 RepID=UPI0023F2E528|nr:HmuY family protein [Capnocytophaga granulosa]